VSLAGYEYTYNGRSLSDWLRDFERSMEFYLNYDGPLPSEPASPSAVKNDIRKQLHPQLRDLWNREHILKAISGSQRNEPAPDGGPQVISGLEFHARDFIRGPFRFVPLVCDDFGITCDLDILFFRRENPGSLIKKPRDEYGGDLDNRMKIFFGCT
jgi:hypothetical protein